MAHFYIDSAFLSFTLEKEDKGIAIWAKKKKKWFQIVKSRLEYSS